MANATISSLQTLLRKALQDAQPKVSVNGAAIVVKMPDGVTISAQQGTNGNAQQNKRYAKFN